MTDYCTTAEVKAQINKSKTEDDAVIAAIITAACRAIDNFCNRPDGFVAVSVAAARLYTGSGLAWQRIDDCVEITLVEVKASATDTTYTSWAATDWIAFSGDPEQPNFNTLPYQALMCLPSGDYSVFNSGIFITRGGFRPDPDQDTKRGVPMVRVTAKWGYAVTVPAPIKQAAITQTARWYKRGEGSWSDVLATGELGMLLFRQSLDPDLKMMLVHGRYIAPPV